jgi:hypothetical protein
MNCANGCCFWLSGSNSDLGASARTLITPKVHLLDYSDPLDLPAARDTAVADTDSMPADSDAEHSVAGDNVATSVPTSVSSDGCFSSAAVADSQRNRNPTPTTSFSDSTAHSAVFSMPCLRGRCPWCEYFREDCAACQRFCHYMQERDILARPVAPLTPEERAWLSESVLLQSHLTSQSEASIRIRGEINLKRQKQGRALLGEEADTPSPAKRQWDAYDAKFRGLAASRFRGHTMPASTSAGIKPGDTMIFRSSSGEQHSIADATLAPPALCAFASAGVEPAVAETAVAEPAVAETAVAEPAFAETPVAEPAVAETAVAEPAVAEKAVAEPAFAETPVAEPAFAESAAVTPVGAGGESTADSASGPCDLNCMD